MKTKQLTHSLAAKIGAFFLLVITTVMAVGSVAGAGFLVNSGFYTQSIHELKEDAFYYVGNNAGYAILRKVLSGDTQGADTYCRTRNLYAAISSDKDGRQIWSNFKEGEASWRLEYRYATDSNYNAAGSSYNETESSYNETAATKENAQETLVSDIDSAGSEDSSEEYVPETETYTARLYLQEEIPEQSQFYTANRFVNMGYALRYWVYPLGILALILVVSCFIFLICSAGRKAGKDEIQTGAAARIPFDLLTGLLGLAVFFAANIMESVKYNGYSDVAAIAILAIGFIAALVLGTLYCMNFALRVKLGGWWKNTVIYRLLQIFLRAGRAVGRGLAVLVGSLPLIWKTAVLALAITLAEFLGIFLCYWETDNLLVLWMLEKLILIPAVLYLALVLYKLQKGGQALAQGDLSYQVDTGLMVWDFKQHGENLKNIGMGMNHAVEERLKSERLKTELITNVSHDIKTPLTSIINYADIICREQTENKKVTEYADVLLRQSERLKKLIEDLVEASKAATGNIDVLPAPCEVGVLLTQTAGEYEQRLRENDLELITKQQDAPIMIMADRRHIWRVFDNLMNNICKYAQSGTRVYLNVEEKSGEAVIAFKNTSKYPLDITTEELLERFVRGDGSRNTDGNGLGLSIAQSLTELQSGKLELTVDGDLFKVILRFKSIH